MQEGNETKWMLDDFQLQPFLFRKSNRPLALRGHVTNASFKTLSWNLADAKN